MPEPFFLIKLQASETLLKTRLWHKCFQVNFAKFLRTPFLQDTSGRLLVKRPMTKMRTNWGVSQLLSL